MTISITGQAGCSYQVMVGGGPGIGYGFGQFSFPSDATAGQQLVTWSLQGLADGLYTIAVTAMGCGPWTVILDRP